MSSLVSCSYIFLPYTDNGMVIELKSSVVTLEQCTVLIKNKSLMISQKAILIQD